MSKNSKEIIQDIWDTIYTKPTEYQFYDLFSPHPDIAWVADKFRKGKVHRILDVGCGIGNNLFFLSQRGFELIGLDISSTALKHLRKLMSERDISAKLIQGNVAEIPLGDGCVEGVICVQSLQHGYEEDIKQGLSEMRRVLKRKGLLFLTVPGRFDNQNKVRYALIKTARRVRDRVFIPTVGKEVGVPHFIFNKRILKTMLREANFELVYLDKDIRNYYKVLAEAVLAYKPR